MPDQGRKRQYNKKWATENKVKVKESNRNWRRNNTISRQAYWKLYMKNHPDQYERHLRKQNLRKYYNLSIEDYDKMLLLQNGLCAICGKPETDTIKGKTKRLSVDHNHKTGKTRALLCGDCNRAIGLFKEEPQIMIAAAHYMNTHNKEL